MSAAQAMALWVTHVKVLGNKRRQPEKGQNARGICRNWTCFDAWPAHCSPSTQGWQRKWNPFRSPVTAPYHELPGEGFLVKTSASAFCFWPVFYGLPHSAAFLLPLP